MTVPALTFDTSLSLGDIVATLAVVLALWGAYRALREFSENLRELKYAEVDRLYFDLQRAALEYPEARHPPAPGGDPDGRYDIYAGMVWAFLETVCDRCERDPVLKSTWSPVVTVEAQRHIDWLRQGDNAAVFKKPFRDRFLEKT
jgi:hypothetical protein